MAHLLRALLATTLVVLLLAMIWGDVWAANFPPQHDSQSISQSLTPAPGLSAACGYAINLYISGTVNTTTFFDASGTPVRATVTFPDFKFTYVNAATGVSITSPSVSVAHVDLITGDVMVTGLTLHLQIPGASAGQQVGEVGRQVFDAMGDLIASSGHFADFLPQLCILLAPAA